MKLSVVLDGRPLELGLERRGENVLFRVGADGAEHAASVVEVEPGIYSMLWGGRSYEVKVVPGPDCLYVDTRDRHLAVQLLDPREPRTVSGRRAAEGPLSVSAPMPGKVVRVLVGQGDRVEAGQGLVVVEAMKMQNEMKAPRPGLVVEVPAREGARVASGEPLVVLG